MLVGLSQIIWTVFGEDANEKAGLSAILLGLHPVPVVVSPAGNHQLLDRETLGSWDLHKDTRAIKRQRWDRIFSQEMKVVQCMCTREEGW